MTFSLSQSVVVGSALLADLLFKSREATVYCWQKLLHLLLVGQIICYIQISRIFSDGISAC